MALLVKICGVNGIKAAEAVVHAGADFAGLVFHAESPRKLSPEAARPLADLMRGRLRLVALVSDADDDAIAAVTRAVRPDFLQLHGHETPERAAGLRARFGIKIIKAILVANAADLKIAPAYEAVADMLLFDAKAPSETRLGGWGAAFDWQLLRERSFSRPWLLAGGLTPANVAEAIAASGALGVDVSSGVETAPGVKSPDLIAEFVSAARSTQPAEVRP